MGSPAHGVISLVLSAAFLIWVNEKTGNAAQKFGKVIAWIAIILSALMLIGQLYICGSMCISGKCMRAMGGPPMMHGMGGGGMGPPQGMPPPPPPAGGK